ncbi:MAG: serine protease [Candidatus Binatia bacterium]
MPPRICAVAVALLTAAPAAALPDTQAVFDRFADSVAQIRIIETSSGAKAVIGSGFAAGDARHVVTNYHVVSQLVYHPDRYRGEAVRRDGGVVPLRLQAIDVVHDVAIAAADQPIGPPLAGVRTHVAQGTRLYALGYPLDLGLTIVEGTFNGFLDHTLYEKIHFTGALNPGMSGGPAITADGAVVGVNVATAGNEVSFLVPAGRVEPLLAQVAAPGSAPPADWLTAARDQVLAYQDAYVARLLAEPVPTEAFAGVRLPGKLAPFVKCWGDAQRSEKERFAVIDHTCSTDDYLFLSADHLSGVIEYSHEILTSDQLNRFQFFSLYSDRFGEEVPVLPGSEDEVTRFVCREALVEQRDTPIKAVFCLRAYRKLPGLYDAVVKAAVLGRDGSGAGTSLTLSGVSFANARALAQRYLEAIAWATP